MNSGTAFAADHSCHRRDKPRIFDSQPHHHPNLHAADDLCKASIEHPAAAPNFQSNLDFMLPFHGQELAQIMLLHLPPNPNQPLTQLQPPNTPHCAAAPPGPRPLGPFTGYAAVLKTSRFLKPAQQLLEELCAAVKGGSRGASHQLSDDHYCMVSGSKEANNGQGLSSSSLSCSTELSRSATLMVHSSDFHQKKAKLVCMQDEVCRRYKQYHQQMQMVVSSFESVPGLSTATPFATLALKSISKKFRRMKSTILCQLQEISHILGEESTSSPSSSKGPLMSHSRLPYMEHNHPVWRPQRGLPERAVSVLRAWLFDHFLHPYPTDADKHMLATQTGLTRNQVSNWFINARVRLWKPMVEEIHMLETKGKNGPGSDNSGSTNLPDAKASNIPGRSRQFSNPGLDERGHVNPSLDCSLLDPRWHVDKRSRMQDEAMEGNLISFGGYSGSEMDIGGFGAAVSLTLGLRHDGIQQQQHQLRQFGGHMLHDFVG